MSDKPSAKAHQACALKNLQNALSAEHLKLSKDWKSTWDYKVKKAEKELKRAQKQFKSAKEEKEIRFEALKKKVSRYRTNVKAAEEVMRGRDGWESDDERDEDE